MCLSSPVLHPRQSSQHASRTACASRGQMKLDYGSGNSPRAGSAAFASEEAHRAEKPGKVASAVTSAGRSARAASECSRAEGVPVRAAGLSLNPGGRRERIFTPRPKLLEPAAQDGATEVEPRSGVGATSQAISPVVADGGLQNQFQGNRAAFVPASETVSGVSAGLLFPLKSVLRLFSKKAAGADPS